MKIQIVSQYFAPDNFRINDIAPALAEAGHDVAVLTGLPDYATSRVPREFKRKRRRREDYHGVRVRRVPIIARRSGVFFRMLNYFSFVVSGCLWALFTRERADVVFAYETSPVLQVLPAVLFARRRRCPLVIYCLDLWPESMKVWGMGEGHPLFRLTRRLSGWLFRKGRVVAYSSAPFRTYLREVNGVDDARLVELPQHAEDLYADMAGDYVDNGIVDFVFAGNIGAAQGVETLVRAAALVDAPDLAFLIHLVGDGSARESCAALTRELGVENRVVFHGKHPLEAMKRVYLEADCFLLTLTAGTVGDSVVPAKLQGYMGAGKPVVAAAGGGVADVIAEADCGVAVPAEDAAALARAIETVMQEEARFKEMGVRGRQYFERHYRREIFTKKLETLLLNAMDKGEEA